MLYLFCQKAILIRNKIKKYVLYLAGKRFELSLVRSVKPLLKFIPSLTAFNILLRNLMQCRLLLHLLTVLKAFDATPFTVHPNHIYEAFLLSQLHCIPVSTLILLNGQLKIK